MENEKRFLKNKHTGLIFDYDPWLLRMNDDLAECDADGNLIGVSVSKYSDILFEKIEKYKTEIDDVKAENEMLKIRVANLTAQLEEKDPLAEVRKEFYGYDLKKMKTAALEYGFTKVDLIAKTKDDIMVMITTARERIAKAKAEAEEAEIKAKLQAEIEAGVPTD